MRVLILNANLRERGTYFRARKIAEGLHRRGHDITFVHTGDGFYRPRHGPNRERWAEYGSASWSPFRSEEGHSPLGLAQRLWALRGKWDLIYTFSHLPVDQGTARFIRARGGFWITDWCDLWNSRLGGYHDLRNWPRPLPKFARGLKGARLKLAFRCEDFLEARAAIDADAVSIIVSPMREYTRRLGIPDERALHLVSGADTERIAPLDREECRAKLGLNADGKYFAYVANYTPDNIMFEAALEIVFREMPELKLISVGPRWYEEGTFAAKCAAEGRIIDYDRKPFAEVPTYIGAADFVTMPLRDIPSNRCRWPNKFGDYMAAGRAVATSDVGDMGEIIRREGVGVAGPATAEGFAAAILTLARDPELCRTAGERGREAALKHFDWDTKVEELCAYLRCRGVAI
ncbi:N/A [soil metagenome]